MGTESSGDCKNVTFSNCSCFSQPNRTGFLGGIGLEAVDGAHVENITITNITMIGARSPIFLRLGNRGRAQQVPTPGSLEHISISNITAQNAIIPCIIAGIPNFPVKHIIIENIMMTSISDHSEKFIAQQNEAKKESNIPKELQIREEIQSYPDVQVFGILPSWGVYCRHATNIIAKNIILRCLTPDHRCAAVFDDITKINLDTIHVFYEIDENKQMRDANLPLFWFHNTKNCDFKCCNSNRDLPCYMRISGDISKRILIQTDSMVEKDKIVLDSEVDKKEIIIKN
jgi:hypothetical protein